MSFAELLESEFREANVDVSSPALDRLALYASEMERWNRSVNLTSLHGSALARRLIVEPVCIGRYLNMDGVLADVGSGNGSPGIPLCITRNFSSAHLIEPRMKRAAFLRHAIGRIGLKDVEVNRNRIEEVPENSFHADWIVLQALDPTPEVVDALTRIAAETTRVVWITSRDRSPVANAEKVQLPNISTKIWVFRLDQI